MVTGPADTPRARHRARRGRRPPTTPRLPPRASPRRPRQPRPARGRRRAGTGRGRSRRTRRRRRSGRSRSPRRGGTSYRSPFTNSKAPARSAVSTPTGMRWNHSTTAASCPRMSSRLRNRAWTDCSRGSGEGQTQGTTSPSGCTCRIQPCAAAPTAPSVKSVAIRGSTSSTTGAKRLSAASRQSSGTSSARQWARDGAHVGHAAARLVAVLEQGRIGGGDRDDLDLRRNHLEREIVAVAREQTDGEAEPMGRDRRIEGGAARARGFAEAVEGDVPDGDEVRRAHARVRA